MKKNTTLRKLWQFSRSENRGIVLLLLLLLGIIAFRYVELGKTRKFNLAYSRTYLNENPDGSFDAGNTKRESPRKSGADLRRITYQPFDPNQASIRILNELGFPDFISRRIIKYRERGGRFQRAEDLYRIYGIDSSHVKKLIPYIHIEHISDSENSQFKMVNKKQQFIEINSADTLQFETLFGIGPVLSRRIANYRNSIGGFYSTLQLLEVYGIEQELYNQIANQLIVDTSFVRKIELNTASLEELSRHPYLSRYEAKAILAYRRVMGNISSKEELRENYILSEHSYKKMAHYMDVD